MIALWDTTGTEVVRKLAAERRHGGVASGLALTLVVVVDEPRVREIEDAITIAAAEHPCRLLVVTRTPPVGTNYPDRLDAEIVVGGRFGPCEAVIMRTYGRLALHAESVVMPLLAPDVPVVTWWHGPPPDQISQDPLGVIAERRITDTAQADDPVAALRQRAVDYASGDTDLAWTRITGWRTLVAGALDSAADTNREATVAGATLTAPPSDAGAALLGGWLAARLGIAPQRRDPGSPAVEPALESLRLDLAGGGEITISHQDGAAVLQRTGHGRRSLPLVARTISDELAEELRRLGPDRTYATALSAATGVPGLPGRPANRVHTWIDPAIQPPAEQGLVERGAKPHAGGELQPAEVGP